jgi:hypothetical protein
MTDASPDRVLDEADVIVAMSWPPADEATLAMAGMAAGRAVVVFEAAHTAGWPALDPQTWQPRGWTRERPVVVSVDPRDEEHSLSLALRRLANDSALRGESGPAAHEWWHEHATVDQAARAWRSILDDAVTLTPPQRPANWPRHLTADGTERAREIWAVRDQSISCSRRRDARGQLQCVCQACHRRHDCEHAHRSCCCAHAHRTAAFRAAAGPSRPVDAVGRRLTDARGNVVTD